MNHKSGKFPGRQFPRALAGGNVADKSGVPPGRSRTAARILWRDWYVGHVRRSAEDLATVGWRR